MRYPVITDLALAPTIEAPMLPDPPGVLATLPIKCMTCGGPVSVEFVTTSSPAPHTWPCPYCGAENRLTFPGAVIWIVPGHGPAPTV